MSDEQKPVRYRAPGPTLDRFFASNARKRLIAGPFGSGKSVASQQEIVRRARLQMPDTNGVRKTRWMVVRNTYDQLKTTTVKTWKDWFGPQFGTFIDSAPFEHRLKFPLADGSLVEADVLFRAMDKSEDVNKFLSFEGTGVYFNEIREIRKELVDAADGRIGRYPSMRDGGATWIGIWGDTNMPDEDHWIYDAAEKDKESGWELFKQPGGVIKVGGKWVHNPDAENIENLRPGYYTEQLPGKSDSWIAVYLGAEFAHVPTEGTYFAEEMIFADREGRIGDVFPDRALPVHTFWDMGVGDDMVLWFGQGSAGNWRWVDYYENSGKNLGHYANVIAEKAKDRRWTIGREVWPHDGNVREMTAIDKQMKIDDAKRRADVWKELVGRDPIVLANAPLSDGIEASRTLMGVSRFDKTHCAEGIRKLRRYKRHLDKTRNVFTSDEEHDENAHCGAAWRTAGMGRNKVSNTAPAWPEHVIHQAYNAA
jgi:hypothetical protein